jgi:ABC-type antimicrobial peptide transport system permease subunit
LLGAVSGVLGVVAAVGHALITAVWRRARDIAILRALGMTPRQSRWAALTQATVFSVAGLLAGIPPGLAAGRALWRVTAGIIPLYYQPPPALGILLLTGPAVLACGLLLALIPGTARPGCAPRPCCAGNEHARAACPFRWREGGSRTGC